MICLLPKSYHTSCVVQQFYSPCLKPFVCVIRRVYCEKNYTIVFIKDQRRHLWLNNYQKIQCKYIKRHKISWGSNPCVGKLQNHVQIEAECLRVDVARGWWNDAALRAHCHNSKNGQIRHPCVHMGTYLQLVVSHDGWLTYPMTAVSNSGRRRLSRNTTFREC